MAVFSTENPAVVKATARWKKAELIAGLRNAGVKTIDEKWKNQQLATKLLNILGKAPDKAQLLAKEAKVDADAQRKQAVADAKAAREADKKKSAVAAAKKKGGDGAKKQTAILVDGAAGKKSAARTGDLNVGDSAANARAAAAKASAKAKGGAAPNADPHGHIDGSTADSPHMARIQRAVGNWSASKTTPASLHAPINVIGMTPEEAEAFKASTKMNRVQAKYFRRITEDGDDPGSEVLAIWMSPVLVLAITRALHLPDTSRVDVPAVFTLEVQKVIKHYEGDVFRPWCIDIERVVKQHVLNSGGKVSDFFFFLSEEAGSSAVQHRILTHLATAVVIGYHRHSRFPFKDTEGIYAAALLQAEARDVPAANAYVGEMSKLVHKPDPKTIAQGLGTPPARSLDGGRGGRATSPLPWRGYSEEPFRGTCYHCQQQAGHTAKNCPDKDKPKAQRKREKRVRGGQQKGGQQAKRQQPKAPEEK
jgi:hypothetical protein